MSKRKAPAPRRGMVLAVLVSILGLPLTAVAANLTPSPYPVCGSQEVIMKRLKDTLGEAPIFMAPIREDGEFWVFYNASTGTWSLVTDDGSVLNPDHVTMCIHEQGRNGQISHALAPGFPA